MTLFNVQASTNGRLAGHPAGTWASIWAGSQGKVYGPTETNPDNLSGPQASKTVSDWLFRSYLDFDLTPYTAADFDEVSEANIYVYVPGAGVANPNTQGINAANAVNITKGVWTNLPPQWNADWIAQNTETTIQGSLTSVPTLGAYAAIPFNSTGLTWLATMAGQNLKVCLRMTRDIDNNPWLPPAISVLWHYLSQETGYEPYIEFTGYSSNRIYVFLGTLASPTLHELTDPADPYVLAARTERGRDEETAQASAGIAEIICDNFNGDFNPENDAGAFYGDLELDKTIYVYEKYNDVIYKHFFGKIQKIIPHGEKDYPYAHILAVDGMDDMAEKDIRTVLRSDTDTGELAADVLDALDWPAGDRDLDTGIDTLQLGWFDKIKALDALRVLELHEDGFFYIDVDGTAIWENRHHRITGDGLVSQYDFEDTPIELPYEYSKRYYYNQVTVKGKRYFPDGATLWSGYDLAEIDDALVFSAHTGDVGAPYIPQGLTITFWAEFNAPLASYTSLVKGTHWNANAEPDKSGDDLSDNISISETQYGQAVKIAVTNNGSVNAYLVEPDSPPVGAPSDRTLLLYGILYAEEVHSMTVEDVPTGANIRELLIEAPFMSNPNDVLAHAQYLHAKYGTPRPRAVSVKHAARQQENALRVQCLSRKISDRITVKSTRLNFDKDFYINKVIQDYVFLEGGIKHETTWVVESSEGTAEQLFWLLGVTNFGELGIATVLGR